jgi:two-component system, OmpR family, response regulator
MRILCVGAGRRAGYLTAALMEASHSVAALESVEDAAWLIAAEHFDAVVALTHGDAVEVSRLLGARPEHVILAVVDTPAEHDVRVGALYAGADICLGPQLDYAELDARLGALWRDVAGDHAGAGTADVVLSRAARCLHGAGGAKVDLSRREYLLLERLLRDAGAIVGHDDLIAYVFDDIDSDGKPLRRLAADLRRRIADSGIDLHVEAIPRVGYRARVQQARGAA